MQLILPSDAFYPEISFHISADNTGHAQDFFGKQSQAQTLLVTQTAFTRHFLGFFGRLAVAVSVIVDLDHA